MLWSISLLCVSHLGHRNRKCATVSRSYPQPHCGDAVAFIIYSELFSLVMPVLICDSTLRSSHGRSSYSRLVCAPGRAASTLLACLPTSSGKLLSALSFFRWKLRVVDFILAASLPGIEPCLVACLASRLADYRSSFSLELGIQKTSIPFPPFHSLLMLP